MTNLVVMEQHLELVKVEPALGLPGLEVVVEVPRREAEGVELLVRAEEENCRRLLVVDTCHHHSLSPSSTLIWLCLLLPGSSPSHFLMMWMSS